MIIKVLASLSKLRKEEHRNYFKSIIYRIIMKVNKLNNCKSAQMSFKTKKRGTKKLFHGHYLQDYHEGKEVK